MTYDYYIAANNTPEKIMATKIKLECELLMVEHDIKHNRNNSNAFAFRATLDANPVARAENATAAAYYHNCKLEAEARATNIRNLLGAFA